MGYKQQMLRFINAEHCLLLLEEVVSGGGKGNPAQRIKSRRRLPLFPPDVLLGVKHQTCSPSARVDRLFIRHELDNIHLLILFQLKQIKRKTTHHCTGELSEEKRRKELPLSSASSLLSPQPPLSSLSLQQSVFLHLATGDDSLALLWFTLSRISSGRLLIIFCPFELRRLFGGAAELKTNDPPGGSRMAPLRPGYGPAGRAWQRGGKCEGGGGGWMKGALQDQVEGSCSSGIRWRDPAAPGSGGGILQLRDQVEGSCSSGIRWRDPAAPGSAAERLINAELHLR
ncbi:unnamed protein product [Pleuronectes platessa]|uniref:Uncharacterized protein n=1 Tax=Pleuronectes platessa TaxID=8262 RepID=A0A9N7YH00_PLEPL|nr:unnamed protein product [Pleuronectes platessa]